MKKFFLLVWQGWKKFAHVLGIVNTKILLTITYFVFIAIVSIVSRIFRADFLHKRLQPAGVDKWHGREPVDATLEGCRRQF